MLHEEPGVAGAFTRGQADGARPNGTVGYKTASEPGDAHQDGEKCIVLGSIAAGGVLVYFVAWQDMPLTAVAVASHRLRFD